jgi:long-chain acyl-CoA synthetase
MKGMKGKKIEPIDQETLSSFSQYTLPQILALQAERLGTERIAIREKAYGIWQAYHWQDYLRYTRHVALGFLALGLERGENVALLTNNHPEWLFSELGGQAMGAVTVNLFTSSFAKEMTTLLNRIQASYVIAQDQGQIDKLLANKQGLSHVRKVIWIDPTGMRTYTRDPWLMSFKDLLNLGAGLDREHPNRFEEELSKGKPEEINLMVMTPGTTGLPKLVMLSHQNFTEMARKWLETAPIGMGDKWVSIHPPAWIVEQMWGVGVSLLGGMIMNFPEALDTAMEDYREIGPTVMLASSRYWEDMASKIRVKVRDAGFIKRKLFAMSEKIGEAVVNRDFQEQRINLRLQFLNWLASKFMFRPLMDRVGCSQIRAAYTGGHPISPDVIRFFCAKGLNLKQCYGLTESGGIFQVQPDGEIKPETVGKPLPRTVVRILEDQEVFVSSDSNFVGYYQDPEATQKVLRDGWLRTGDAGYIDGVGHLVIIGRKEEIIHTKGGEAFSPDFIESRLRFSPYIREVVVFGECRPYIIALIDIDMENVGNWAKDRMIPYTTYTDLSQRPAVNELILGEVCQVNTKLSNTMKVRKIILLYKPLDADDEELTRTGKVRRKFVYEHYDRLFEAMYSDEKEIEVTGKIRYRDGTIGTLETKVRVLTVE